MKLLPEKLIYLSNFILSNKLSLFLFSLLSLIYLWSYAIIPFHDHDSVIYAIRGELIFRGIPIELLPFDHKPLGLNIIYGLFGYFIQYGHGQSLIVSLFFNALTVIISYLLITSLIDKKIGKKRKVLIPLLVFLIIFQSPFIGLSGNSETLTNFFILTSLYFLLVGLKKKYMLQIFFSGLFLIFAMSMNLLAIPILSLPTLYLLFQASRNRNKNILAYLTGTGLGLLALTFLYLNMGDMHSYFRDLLNFYQIYGDRTQDERLRAFLYFFRSLIIFLPILISALYLLNKTPKLESNLILTLIIWTISAFLACLISGNDLVHYFSFLVAPLIVLSGILFINFDLEKKAIVFFVPLFYCMTYMSVEIYDNQRKLNIFEITSPEIQKISQFVPDDEKLLSIRIGHVPFFLAGINPNQKYLFPQNANFFEDSNEDIYWTKSLKDYNYAITPKNICESEDLPSTCNALYSNYRKVYASSNLEIFGAAFVKSFEIYEKIKD